MFESSSSQQESLSYQTYYTDEGLFLSLKLFTYLLQEEQALQTDVSPYPVYY